MMARTQLSLEREMQRKARRRAEGMGISLAEYIRRLVDRDLAELGEGVDPSIIFGLGEGGEKNIARDKDRLTGEAVAAGRKK